MATHAVILLNLGAPDSMKSIAPFLYNLFRDPDLFTFPFNNLFASLVSRLRTLQNRKQYMAIGGKSPLLGHTIVQARMLEEKLKPYISAKVYIGMRYWHPLIEEALKAAVRDNAEKFIFLPLYPQYSLTTTGSSINEAKRLLKKQKLDNIKITTIKSYADNEFFTKAHRLRIEESLSTLLDEDLKSLAVIFSAHGIPSKFIDKGDIYLDEVKRSMNAIVSSLKTQSLYKEAFNNSITTHLSFQSKVGPIKWLKPSTIDIVKRLAQEGIENLVVVPISFVSDHMETLFELRLALKETAIKKGVKKFMVVKALNDSDPFIEALKNIILEAISNEQ